MRTVSFVERLEFECQGNVVSKSLAVGDVDNDKGYELVIGNVHGDLFIHKGRETRPWRKASDLGMITCLDIGDVCNHGINFLVVSSLEGWCHVFAVKPDAPSTESGVEPLPDEYRVLKPAFRQHLPANSKGILIADIDGDGHNELVIGYSDRRVRSFRWLDAGGDQASGSVQGEFIALETWQLAGQMGSLTVNKRQGGSVDLMVSQPGGTFVTLLDRHVTARRNARPSRVASEEGEEQEEEEGGEEEEGEEEKCDEQGEGEKCSEDTRCVHHTCLSCQPPARVEELKLMAAHSEPFDGPSLMYHPLGNARARNPGVTTEVVGNISRRKKDEEKYVPSYCAICTLDGTLTLVDEDKILWSLYVDHQLFTLTKVDITGDGTEEVVACSWDGRTYLVNLSRDVVRFHFNEHVAAFCAGYYWMPGEGNVPCLIYVTFNNRVVVYYNINMPQIGVTNLLETMEEQTGTEDLLAYYNVDTTNKDELRQLYHWCLYGRRDSTT